MKRENISSLQADSQNLRGNPPCERFVESSVDSETPSPLSFDSFSQKGCTPHPAPPTRQKLPLFAFRGRASLSPLLAKNRRSHYCSLESDFLHHEAGEFRCFARILKKFLLLFAFTKRRVPLNFIDFNQASRADSQNLAINFLKG